MFPDARHSCGKTADRFRRRVNPRRRRRPRRLTIDPLEARRVLATFQPSPAADDGDAGSLRAAIIAANGNQEDDTIELVHRYAELGSYTIELEGVAAATASTDDRPVVTQSI